MDCLFCRIIKKEIPSEIVYEDEHTFAFLDIHPCAPGHTMVITKTHAATLLDLPGNCVAPLFLTVQKVTGMLHRSLNPSGFTIGINHGSISGQVIEHLHVHIIPRYVGDGGGSIHGVVNNPSSLSLHDMALKILQY